MKKTLLIALIGALSIEMTGFTSANIPNDILEIQPLLERGLKIKDLTIGDSFQYGDFSTILSKYCSPSSIQTGQKDFESAKSFLSQYLPETHLEQARLFAIIRDQNLTIADKDREKYCQKKFLAYKNLEFLNTLFLQQKEPKNGSSKTNSSPTTPAKTSDIQISSQSSNRTITPHNKPHNSAPTIALNADITLLKSPEEIQLGEQVKASVYEQISTLKKYSLLDDTDLDTFNNNLHISYTRKCDKTRGSFHMTKNHQTGNIRFTGIKLMISLCPPLPSIQKINQHIKHVLNHEIGHYIYFFKDKKTDSFDDICRSKETKKCSKLGFPSTYAQTNKEEDYAESFAYWIKDLDQEQEHGSASISPQMQQKSQHFNRLIKTLNS